MNRLFEFTSKYIFPSNPTSGTIGSIDADIVTIQFAGTPLFGFRYESQKTKILWSVYSAFIMAILTFGYMGFEVYDIVLSWGNLNDITQNTCLSFTHFSAAIKVINTVYHRKQILRIVEQLKFMTEKYVVSEEQKATFLWGEFENKILLVIYTALVWFTCVFAMTVAMLNPGMFGEMFPYRVAIPDFIPKTVQMPYMGVAVFFCAMQVVGIDCLHVNLINQTRYQMKTLNIAFNRMTVGKVDIDTNKYLNSLVEYHNYILQLRTQIESILKFPLLTQFLSSLLIIALTGFQATINSDLKLMVVIYVYWGVIFGELFIYCWLGNEVSGQNETLAFCGYNLSWYDFGRKFRASLLIFLVNAQRPFYFTAGGFMKLSLVTYTSILSKSYSYLAVLRQLYGEK